MSRDHPIFAVAQVDVHARRAGGASQPEGAPRADRRDAPDAELPELLLEIAARTGFTKVFTHESRTDVRSCARRSSGFAAGATRRSRERRLPSPRATHRSVRACEQRSTTTNGYVRRTPGFETNSRSRMAARSTSNVSSNGPDYTALP
jgi:hypothetical protein